MAITTPTRKLARSDMELARNKPYISRAKLLLQNCFLRISCAAIDVVLKSNEFKLPASFKELQNIESQREGINGDGIIATIEYSMVYYILYDDDEISYWGRLWRWYYCNNRI